MPKWTTVRFLCSNSLGKLNLGDNPNNNTTLFDTSHWIYHRLFKSNRQSTGINNYAINFFLLKCLTQN